MKMAVFDFVVVLVLFLVATWAETAQGAECTARFPLTLEYLNTTTQAGNPSTCADGTCA